MVCRNCGEEIPEGKRFCMSCGTPVAQQGGEDAPRRSEAQYTVDSAEEVGRRAPRPRVDDGMDDDDELPRRRRRLQQEGDGVPQRERRSVMSRLMDDEEDMDDEDEPPRRRHVADDDEDEPPRRRRRSERRDYDDEDDDEDDEGDVKGGLLEKASGALGGLGNLAKGFGKKRAPNRDADFDYGDDDDEDDAPKPAKPVRRQEEKAPSRMMDMDNDHRPPAPQKNLAAGVSAGWNELCLLSFYFASIGAFSLIFAIIASILSKKGMAEVEETGEKGGKFAKTAFIFAIIGIVVHILFTFMIAKTGLSAFSFKKSMF